MPKPPNFPTLAPNRRVQVAVLLSGLVILLFIIALSGFLSAWKDMKEAVRDNQASRLATEVDTNFQLAISKGKNFAILKDEVNKTRAMDYFKRAQARYADLSAFEKDPQGQSLLYKLGAALKSVEFSLGILTAQAKKSDSADKLYRRYLKDITIDFDEASQAYVEYLNQRIQQAQAELYSNVRRGLWVVLVGVFLALGVMALSLSVVENLRRALRNETALGESEARLRLFDNLAEEAIMIRDQETIVDVNPALCRMLGYDSPEIIGKPVSLFMDQGSAVKARDYLEKGYPKGSYEITAKRKDGTTFPLLVHGHDFMFRGRKMRASSGWDITERKKAQQALQENQDRFQRLAEVTREGILIHDQGTVVDANPVFASMLGYTMSEMVGKERFSFLAPESVAIVRKHVAENYSLPYEVMAQRKDGSTFPVEIIGQNFRYNGKDLRVASIWDITERKKAEQNLRHSEENFRTLIEQAPDAILVIRNGKHTYANKRCLGLLGFENMEELSGKNPMEIIHPDDRETILKRLQRTLRGDENPSIEVRLVHRDGSTAEVETTSVGIQFEGFPSTMVILRDIRDRKKAEEALRQSEAKFRSLIENSYDLITVLDRNGQRLYESPSLERILGFKPGERKGLTFDTQPLEEQERARRVFEEAVANPGVPFRTRLKALRKDGRAIDADMVITNLLDDPAVRGIVVNGRDVTEKMRAEEALRQSEENFRNLIENSNDVISVVGTDMKANYVSPSIRKIMGYDPEERVGHSFLEIVHPDDKAMVTELFREFVYKPAVTVNAEVRALHKNGSWRYLDAAATNLLNHPSIRGIIFNYRDVTERKLAEKALMESEENFRDLIEKSPDAMIVHSPGRIVYVNEALIKLLGYEGHHRLLGKNPNVIVHPDDREAVNDRVRRLKPGKGYNPPAERRFLTLEGKIVPVEVVSFSILFQGEPMVVAVARDLTERKLAEENFKNLTEKSPDAILIHRTDKILYANPAFLKLTGYEKVEELVGKPPEVIVPPEEREKVAERFKKIQQPDHVNPPVERLIFRKDGRRMPVEVVSFSILFQGGMAAVVVMRDLTERKETEQALMRFERLSTIGEMAAGIAHEIRNPLSAISAAAQILQRKSQRDSSDDLYLGTIVEQTHRLNRLVLDTLQYARAEKPLEKEDISLKEALESAVRLCQIQFGPSHTKVKVEWDLPKKDMKIQANPQRLQQILINLILNAYQIMPEGGTLRITLKSDKNSAFIRVEDTGPGIKDEDMKRIFEPFFTTKGGGSGLGLALSQRIAKEHGGEIALERLTPNGTAFTLRVPFGEGKGTGEPDKSRL